MTLSKCCNAPIKGKGGNEGKRIYFCTNCKKEVILSKSTPLPPRAQKIKDNPVASLDNKIRIISNEYEAGKRTARNAMYEIKQILQNAVETDKEEPEKKYTPDKLGTLIAEIQGGLKEEVELNEAMEFLKENGITEL